MTISLSSIFSQLAARSSQLAIAISLTALPLSAQWTVDRSLPITATNFHTITLAVNAAAAGDTITVFGASNGSGALPFSDAQTGEVFPILLKPGCTLTTGGSIPVYVWNTQASAPNLIEIQGTTTLSLTRVLGIHFLGGANAILAKSDSSSNQIRLLVRDCRFAKNQYGVSTIKEVDGHAEASIRSCTIGDSVPTTGAAPPHLNPPTAGLRFHASGNPTVGVAGEVIDLSTNGAFASMNPQPAPWNSGDLGKPAVSRLVEVYAFDDDGQVQYPSAPSGNYTPSQINEISVDVQGGNWVGGDVSIDGGWDVGLLAQARGQGTNGIVGFESFTSGYTVTMAGTTVTGFREEGIYADGSLNGRGSLTLSGNCVIEETDTPSASFDDQRFNGIHLYTQEGYMGLTCSSSSFLHNRGNGLYANSGGEFNTAEDDFRLGAPYGIYLEVAKAKFHNNDSHGIYLRNQPEVQAHGWLGGTIHQDPGKQFNQDTDSGSFLEPNGQGLINRCGISNNGKAGVRILASGDSGLNSGGPDDNPSGISIRLSNSIVWNNPEGGFSANWLNGPLGEETNRKGYFLAPVSHSTFVKNGSAPSFDWSMEIDDQNSFSGAGRCFYERVDPGPLATKYRTNLWNNIFVRDPFTGSGPDFGIVLNNIFSPNLTVIDFNTFAYQDHQIAVGGCRGIAFWGANKYNSSAQMSDDAILPMLGSGSYLLSSVLPNQFFLDPLGPPLDIKNDSPFYFNVLSPETVIDFNAQIRPSPSSGLRDKGGDED